MVKNNCMNCSNAVGRDYCTMQKNMQVAMYKKCDGWIQVPKKPSIKERILTYEQLLARRRRLESKSNKGMGDENFTSDFLRFVKTGGSWSIRENKRLV